MNYTYKQLKKGFVIRADQQNWQSHNKNNSFLRYLYLESFHQYLPKKRPETFEYNWTAYGHEAYIFIDRVEAINFARKLAAANKDSTYKTKYQVLTFKFADKQDVK